MSGQVTGAGRVVEAQLDVPADLASVSSARQFVRSELARNGLAEMTDVVVLLTSEVVTNAIRHAGSPCRVVMRISQESVRVEVTDGSTEPVHLRPGPPDAESGRGLQLLDRLAGHWGTLDRAGGKSVWFDVRGPAGRP